MARAETSARLKVPPLLKEKKYIESAALSNLCAA